MTLRYSLPPPGYLVNVIGTTVCEGTLNIAPRDGVTGRDGTFIAIIARLLTVKKLVKRCKDE
jgi:hypothetical protein